MKIKMNGMTKRVTYANLPIKLIFGTKDLCFVFSMSPEKSISSPGIRVNTDRSDRPMALMRTIPMSAPILYCIKTRAKRPETVVSEEAQISGIDLESATMTASRTLSPPAYSSLYLLQKIIA